MTIDQTIGEVNRAVYKKVYSVIKRVNRQFHLRYYAVVLDEQDTHLATLRMKKTVSNTKSVDFPVLAESLEEFKNLFMELQIENIFGDDPQRLKAEIVQFLNQKQKRMGQHTEKQTPGTLTTADENEDLQLLATPMVLTPIETRVLYANEFCLAAGNKKHSVVCIMEIRNLDEDTCRLFYDKPEFSFLRMVLDYFFCDFFKNDSDNCPKVNDELELDTLYNENITQFLRRMSRLFFGKMYNYLQNGYEQQANPVFRNTVDSSYYINELLENIDDISTKTYERNNPFGSILFCNSKIIHDSSQRIIFRLKFLENDLIRLDDAKRIRKLLEITDEKQDLYLIADHQHIYGLGEVDWGQMKEVLALRLSFKGLSKYDISLVNLDEKTKEQGEITTKGNNKIYQYHVSLLSENLLSITFKDPKLGEDSYTTEKLRTLLHSQFFDTEAYEENIEKIEVLENIIQSARQQQQGTLVVITDKKTAGKEMSLLKKQSTRIQPETISPEYIKYLTSIDGAIYFDLTGACHGIGVILDGIAKEDYGDASRGARYNSAHRYREKLNENGHKCVIAIVSEDGMVDLVPELDNEDKVFDLVQEIIDIINIENAESNKLQIKEEELWTHFKYIDYRLFHDIARAFFNKRNYQKSIEYCLKCVEAAGDHQFISSDYMNLLGNSYLVEKDYKSAVQCYEKAIMYTNYKLNRMINSGNLGEAKYLLAKFHKRAEPDQFTTEIKEAATYLELYIKHFEGEKRHISGRRYNVIASCHHYLGNEEKRKSEQKECFLRALSYYTKAININRDTISYSNRALVHEKLEMFQEALQDLIDSQILQSSESNLDSIRRVLDSNLDLWAYAIEYFEKNNTRAEEHRHLVELLHEYKEKMGEHNYANSEIAPAQE